MTMDNVEYHALEVRFRLIFELYSDQLSKEARENVVHFINVVELEMACESFILSALEEQLPMSASVKNELLDLALSMRLDKHSVFRADFWQIVHSALGSRS